MEGWFRQSTRTNTTGLPYSKVAVGAATPTSSPVPECHPIIMDQVNPRRVCRIPDFRLTTEWTFGTLLIMGRSNSKGTSWVTGEEAAAGAGIGPGHLWGEVVATSEEQAATRHR